MSFGEHLRQAREQRRIPLRTVSERTNISLHMLEALEREEFDKLPGGIFTRSFVRAYANEVGLDPDETVELFLRQFSPGAGPESAAAGHPQEHARAIAAEAGAVQRERVSLQVVAAVVAGLVVFVLVTYGALRLVMMGRPSSQPTARPAPDTPTETLPRHAENAARPRDGITVQRTLTTDNAEVLTIDIHPQAPCWVRLTVDGRVEYAKLMEPGERITRQARQGFVIQAGDAAAFRYTVNQVPGRSLGSSGQVVTARIDRSNLDQFVTPQ
jgi:cytoskeleton protein RodZ